MAFFQRQGAKCDAVVALLSMRSGDSRPILGGVVCARFSGMLRGDEVDRMTERVISCAIEVHRTMGPGLLESIYQECLLVELQREGLCVECERSVPVDYKNRRLKSRFAIDLLVEGVVIVEVKAIEFVKPVHKAQLISYLKLTNVQAGLLINFNNVTLAPGISRLDHPDRYVRRQGSRDENPEE